MSLLTICQNAAREIGFPVPNSVVTNTADKSAQQFYRFANRTGESMSKEKRWSDLLEEHTFPLVTATQTYALPADFRYLIPETTWNRDDQRPVKNPLSSQEWAFYKGWQTLTGINLRARIKNSLFEFEQAIAATDNGKTIAFEYVSKYWATDSGGTAKANFSADSDLTLLDEEIITLGVIYRFKRSKGLDWVGDFQEYQSELSAVKGYDGGSKVISLSAPSGKYRLPAITSDRDFG